MEIRQLRHERRSTWRRSEDYIESLHSRRRARGSSLTLSVEKATGAAAVAATGQLSPLSRPRCGMCLEFARRAHKSHVRKSTLTRLGATSSRSRSIGARSLQRHGVAPTRTASALEQNADGLGPEPRSEHHRSPHCIAVPVCGGARRGRNVTHRGGVPPKGEPGFGTPISLVDCRNEDIEISHCFLSSVGFALSRPRACRSHRPRTRCECVCRAAVIRLTVARSCPNSCARIRRTALTRPNRARFGRQMERAGTLGCPRSVKLPVVD